MELKQMLLQQLWENDLLLIVPYGIETDEVNACQKAIHLLIVPYGIETIIFVSLN